MTQSETRAASIAVTDLTVRFGGRVALDRVSLDLGPGERVSILGPSGSGKSTLLRCLAGLEHPAQGEIRIGDRLATQGRRHLLAPRHRSMAMVFQDLGLWPHLSIGQTLNFCARPRAASGATRSDAVSAMVERLELSGRERSRPGELSGGEQQRLALGRALIAEPAVLLLDEPFTALDLLLRRSLIEMLNALQRELGFTLIQVTHDPTEALRIAERIVLLEKGRIVWDGPAQELAGVSEGFGAQLVQALHWWRAESPDNNEVSA